MIQRRTPLKRGTSQLKRTPLRKVSKKRAKEGKIYSEKRKSFLEAHPICQVWLQENGFAQDGIFFIQISTGKASGAEGILGAFSPPLSCDIHHKAKRTGTNYLDESTWLAVCRENHDRIHNNPGWARANGFLK